MYVWLNEQTKIFMSKFLEQYSIEKTFIHFLIYVEFDYILEEQKNSKYFWLFILTAQTIISIKWKKNQIRVHTLKYDGSNDLPWLKMHGFFFNDVSNCWCKSGQCKLFLFSPWMKKDNIQHFFHRKSYKQRCQTQMKGFSVRYILLILRHFIWKWIIYIYRPDFWSS